MEARISVTDLEDLFDFNGVRSSGTKWFYELKGATFLNCRYIMIEVEDQEMDDHGVFHLLNSDGDFIYSFKYEDDYETKEYIVDISKTNLLAL
jgi:hypothetical protein